MKRSPQQPSGIDDYISGSPENVRGVLEQVRAAIRKAAPDATETIKCGIPTFVLGENLVHFAAFKKHIGFYPTPSAIAAFQDQLSGCVKRIPNNFQIDFEVSVRHTIAHTARLLPRSLGGRQSQIPYNHKYAGCYLADDNQIQNDRSQ